MPGRLNSFQKTMLQWNELHPYNAIHVAGIRAPLELERLRTTLTAVLKQRGLGYVALYHGHTLEYHRSESAPELRVVSGSGPDALAAEIEYQLNTKFSFSMDTNPFVGCCPFRFFVAPQKDFFYLGLVYFHAISDAESVVHLLKDLVAAYLDPARAPSSESIDLYPARRDRFSLRPARAARKLGALFRLMRNMRDSVRPKYGDLAAMETRFTMSTLAPAQLRAVIDTSAAWDVTVNDLLLALLFKSFAPIAATRLRSNRGRMSVGCIVNTRRELQLEGRGTFGLFLGSFILTRDIPQSTDLRELAREIRGQTERIKRDKFYVGVPLDMVISRSLLSFFSTAERKRLYQKHYPLWGGITNMNLNALWNPRDEPRLADYFRAVSTGPVTPLVLSVTTAGDRANLGFTWRPTVFTADAIEAMKNYFADTINQLGARA